MSVVFRADDEPVAARLDRWQHVLGETFGPIDLGPPVGAHFPQRLVVGDVGALRVAEMTIAWATASAHCRAERTARLIRRSASDSYRIDLLVSGQMMVEQDGRRSSLGSGDFTLIDQSRPARWTTSAERSVAAWFPRALLPLPPNQVARLTAVRIPGDHGIRALLSSFARQLPRHLDDYGAVDGARLGTAVVDVVTAALATWLELGRKLPPDSRQRALLMRVHSFIEARLGDPALSPSTIAAAHYISVRSLHNLFEAQPHTVAGWIRQRRLERCRRDLLDPALRARPVSAIAARWGLTDPAHFTRIFRAAYGVPPGEYRLRGDGSSQRERRGFE